LCPLFQERRFEAFPIFGRDPLLGGLSRLSPVGRHWHSGTVRPPTLVGNRLVVPRARTFTSAGRDGREVPFLLALFLGATLAINERSWLLAGLLIGLAVATIGPSA